MEKLLLKEDDDSNAARFFHLRIAERIATGLISSERASSPSKRPNFDMARCTANAEGRDRPNGCRIANRPARSILASSALAEVGAVAAAGESFQTMRRGEGRVLRLFLGGEETPSTPLLGEAWRLPSPSLA